MNFAPTTPSRLSRVCGFPSNQLAHVSDGEEEALTVGRKPTYLQALLGDNPPTPGGLFGQEKAVQGVDDTSLLGTSLVGGLKVTAAPFLPGASFTTSSFHSVRRHRSLSLSAMGSDMAVPLYSPLRSREHTSEAGSPTMEQVLLMPSSRSPASVSPDFGYGSLLPDFSSSSGGTDSGLYSSLLSNSLDTDGAGGDGDRFSGNTFQPTLRPTFADMVDMDLAVDEAEKNLLLLRQKQVAIHSAFGLAPTTTSSSETRSTDTDTSNLLSNVISALPTSGSVTTSFKSASSLSHAHDPMAGLALPHGSDPQELERAARLYRSAASHCEASCTWSGQLPHRSSTAAPHSSYSTKIFLGGVPWDISEQTLVQAFAEFGNVRVEWPGRDFTSPPKGYLYLVFEDESDIKDLLAKCSQDFTTRDSYYYKISSRRMRAKEVQIIPWVLSDSNYVRCQSPRLDPQKTVFVGALHGMMTAQALAVVFNDLFGGVIYAGLDTDKFKYPIGSGRVTFNNRLSYMKAVGAAFIEIKTPRFSKKVQVDPYLEDTLCSVCGLKQGPYFCRDKACFTYFCHGCWDAAHADIRPPHKPLMRNIRGITRARASHGHGGHHDYNNNGRYRHGGGHHHDPTRSFAEYFSQAFGLQ